MSVSLLPLPIDSLSEPLKKVLAQGVPPQLRMMAARGLSPLGPLDLVIALSQLSLDADEAISGAAKKTAGSLPENIAAAGLAASTEPAVLDFFARTIYAKPKLVERIVLNPNADDETFVFLAGVCVERELELIASNETRILRTPKIIEVLYHNKAARMSTVDRLIELAVRNGVRCEGIPSFDEVAAAIVEQGPPVFDGVEFEVDSQFIQACDADEAIEASLRAAGLASDPEAIERARQALVAGEGEGGEGGSGEEANKEIVQKKKRIQDLPLSAKIRLATVGNGSARAILVRDSNKLVAQAVVNSPALTELEAIAFAGNRSLIPEVISAIARNRSFIKSYQMKLALAFNPKCPFAITLKMLSHLQDGDVRTLAKSKNVPQQLATAARRLMDTRAQKK